MSDIQRFFKDMDGEMDPHALGPWVRFEDHDSIVTELNRSLRREENARDILAKENKRLTDIIRMQRSCPSGNCEE
jgi:hypothetical protein